METQTLFYVKFNTQYVKNTDWRRYTVRGLAISLQLAISLLMSPINKIEKTIGQEEESTSNIRCGLWLSSK